jgi:hypothetical protein
METVAKSMHYEAINRCQSGNLPCFLLMSKGKISDIRTVLQENILHSASQQ